MSVATGFPSSITYSRRPISVSPIVSSCTCSTGGIERSGIDEEFAGPTSFRIRGVANGYVNTGVPIGSSHCELDTPSFPANHSQLTNPSQAVGEGAADSPGPHPGASASLGPLSVRFAATAREKQRPPCSEQPETKTQEARRKKQEVNRAHQTSRSCCLCRGDRPVAPTDTAHG